MTLGALDSSIEGLTVSVQSRGEKVVSGPLFKIWIKNDVVKNPNVLKLIHDANKTGTFLIRYILMVSTLKMCGENRENYEK